MIYASPFYFLFFFKAPATTEIYTLSLHDALPICPQHDGAFGRPGHCDPRPRELERDHDGRKRERQCQRSEEHTSELQSLTNLVCRLLLEKKKKKKKTKQRY